MATKARKCWLGWGRCLTVRRDGGASAGAGRSAWLRDGWTTSRSGHRRGGFRQLLAGTGMTATAVDEAKPDHPAGPACQPISLHAATRSVRCRGFSPYLPAGRRLTTLCTPSVEVIPHRLTWVLETALDDEDPLENRIGETLPERNKSHLSSRARRDSGQSSRPRARWP
jgi:hypothetical protein